MDVKIKNQYGQNMGPKGHLTRERILAVACDLLLERSLEKIRVSDITRAAELALPTFYLYFSDVHDCVLGVITERCDGLSEVARLLDEDWTPESIFRESQRFVRAYFNFWGENAALLSVRNLVCDTGDERFVRQKYDASMPFLQGFVRKIEQFQCELGMRAGIAPFAIASILMASLERIVAANAAKLQHPDVFIDALIESEAYVIALSLLGRQVPVEVKEVVSS